MKYQVYRINDRISVKEEVISFLLNTSEDMKEEDDYSHLYRPLQYDEFLAKLTKREFAREDLNIGVKGVEYVNQITQERETVYASKFGLIFEGIKEDSPLIDFLMRNGKIILKEIV